MERPPEPLKAFANRIARAACSEDASELLRLLTLSDYFGAAPGQAPDGPAAGGITDIEGEADAAVPPPHPDHIGIWERKMENGKSCFVRRMETMPEWNFWANLGRIDAKGGKRRVVLMGESVARGYLYDPQFTPAMALQMILDPQFGEGQVEVIDLARTNLSYEVRELAISALKLEPDIAIIFSGNNWSFDFPGPAGIAQIDEAVTKEGVAGAKRFSEAQVARNARRVARDVSAAYTSAGVPLVWIIPEFNLRDWRDPDTCAPFLPEGENREWLALLGEAQRAARDGDSRRAEELALRMVEMDQGASVSGLYILADCRRQAEDLDGERKYLELARDAVIWDKSRKVMPRTFSVTQRTLREELARYPVNQVVDLPALFKEYLNGGIPGRDLVIDYCHLTSEGIRVAMGAAASCVLRSLKGVEVSWYALAPEDVAPPRETEAEASFLAAIHNGHGWQPYDLLRHFCARALSLSPHIAELMLNYIELQTRQVIPMQMSESDEKISKLGSPLMTHYLLRLNDKRLDKVLLDALVDALAEAGIDARPRLDRLRLEEHSVTVREISLLDYYYCSAADQLQELMWLTLFNDRGFVPAMQQYYKAYQPESRFIFVGEAGSPVRLCLTCRLPEPAPSAAAGGVEFNGKPQVEIELSRRWSTWDIVIAGEAVRDGLNEVAVRWPMPEFRTAAALEQAVSNLCNRKFPNFYPVFGEIHSFTASDGRQAPPDGAAAAQEMSEVGVS